MRVVGCAALLCCAANAQIINQGPKSQPAMDVFDTFNIVGPEFEKFSREQTNIEARIRDGLSFEWDYHMVQAVDEATNEPVFEGMLCTVLMDPRGRFEFKQGDTELAKIEQLLEKLLGWKRNPSMTLVPTGSNAVFVGKWGGEAPMEMADYVNFPRKNTQLGGCSLADIAPQGNCTPARGTNARTIDSELTDNTDACRHGCNLKMWKDGDSVLGFSGTTQHARWNVTIRQDWADRERVPSFVGDDWAKTLSPVVLGEFFTVNMPWLRTAISGTIEKRNADGTFQPKLNIKGHGYRENSWGQWAFVVDGGWDFAIFSRKKLDAKGNGNVHWAWQSYYNENKGNLDHLDVSWCEKGENADGTCVEKHELHLNASQFSWWHPGPWNWSYPAAGCFPTDARVVGEATGANPNPATSKDGGIRVVADLKIGALRQTPILFPTYATQGYVIYEWMPEVKGTIERCHYVCPGQVPGQPAGQDAPQGWCYCDWELVTEFEGAAGGELAMPRSKGLVNSLVTGAKVPILDETSCGRYGKFDFEASLRPRKLDGKY